MNHLFIDINLLTGVALGTDTVLYGIVTIILTQFFVLVGFNSYFLNFLFQSNLPGLMFLSFMLWGIGIAYVLDRITMKTRRITTRKAPV